MVDSIDVQPGERPGKVAVAVVKLEGINYPVYMLADKTGLSVDSDNPLPVASTNADLIASQLDTDNDLLSLLCKIHDELKIMNTYNALAHNQELTKEDAE